MLTPAGKFSTARDGDTIEVTFAIRLAGIKSEDGTERDRRAKERILELLTGKRVDVLWYVAETTYRRLTGKVEFKIEGKTYDLGEVLVEEGLVDAVDRPM